MLSTNSFALVRRHAQLLRLLQLETATRLRWARTLAARRDLPLATVLSWSHVVLMEECGRLLVDDAQREAAYLFHEHQEPPAGDGLYAGAVRAFHAELVAQSRARKIQENNDAIAELIAGGAFG